jgi:hypothetical protein
MTRPQAGPLPILGAPDQAAPQDVPLHVAAPRQEMLVRLHRKRFEASHNVTKLPTLSYESSIRRASLGLASKEGKQLADA